MSDQMAVQLGRVLTEYYEGKTVKKEALFYDLAEKKEALVGTFLYSEDRCFLAAMNVEVETDDDCAIKSVYIEFEECSDYRVLLNQYTFSDCLGAADEFLNTIHCEKEN